VTTVLVDGRVLSPAFSSSGSAAYLRGVLPGLALHGGVGVRALVTADAEVPPGVVRVPVVRRAPLPLGYFEQLVRLPSELRRDNSDLFHSPATDPPRRCSVPWVQTLLDLIPLVVDAPVFRVERRLWKARARRIRNAAAVIAISHHTAQQGIERIGLDPARLHVVHLGVDKDFVPPAARHTDHKPFVLCVSNLAPHKGYREAFGVASMLATAGYPHHLKMVGGTWPSEAHRVRSAMDDCGHADRIELLGRVPKAELIALYQQAAVVIVTSRYEGFGLPALEAMATGTPLVAFDNSSLPEVIADGGILVPDGDVPAFTAAVRSLLDDSRRWEDMSAAGIARASSFDWDRCAREHSQIMLACAP
jgi:glycosyltransferase involved in cell wall biosynthesis